MDAIEASDQLASIVLSVGSLANGADERLLIDGQAIELTNLNNETTSTGGYDVSVSITGSTATVTITRAGGFSAGDAESLLDSMQYENTSELIVNGTRAVTLVSVSDDGGGSDTTASGVVSTVNVIGANDDPTNAGSLPMDVSVNEDVLSAIDLSSLDLADLDDGGGSITVRLSTSTGGNLYAAAQTGITIANNGTASLTLSGTLTDLNAYLDASNLQYQHAVANTAGDNADAIQVEVSDNGNTGPGGGTFINLGSVNVDIAAINDAPVTTAPGGFTVVEDASTQLSGISVGDPDSGAANVETRLTVGNGTLNLTLSGGALITSGGNGSSDVTLRGSVADINATLATLNYTPTQDLFGIAADSLTITTNDLGNTGSGGAQSDTTVSQIDITAVNDAPVLTVNSAATVFEGSSGNTVSGSELRTDDVDDSPTGLTYTVTDAVDNGALTLVGFGALGVGDTFTQADIDAGNVQYDHDDSETLSDSFGFSVSDGGEDGAGPSTGTFVFNITPVNDWSVSPISDTDGTANSVSETASSGTAVGLTALAIDQDLPDDVTYSLDDDAGGRFAIGSTSGVVTVTGGLDFETDMSHDIVVRAISDDGSTTTQLFTIAITDAAEAPVAVSDNYDVVAGQTLNIGAAAGVLANDFDGDGDLLVAVPGTGVSSGALVLQSDGSFVYTSSGAFTGVATFTYRADDGGLLSNEVTVSITVTGAPSPTPDADPDPDPDLDVEDSDPIGETLDPDDLGDSTDPESENGNNEEASESTIELVPPGAELLAEEELEERRQRRAAAFEESESAEALREQELMARRVTRRFEIGAIERSELQASFNQRELALDALLTLDIEQAIAWEYWDRTEEPPEESTYEAFIGTAGAAVGLFSVGYVMWALRGGAFLTVMASTLPAWRFIDPVSILGTYRATQKVVDRVEAMLER